MKNKISKYWLMVVLVFIANIIVFVFLGNRLENYVSARAAEQASISGVY